MDCGDLGGRTALHWALLAGHPRVAGILRVSRERQPLKETVSQAAGASLDKQTGGSGDTVLLCAARGRSLGALAWCLGWGTTN